MRSFFGRFGATLPPSRRLAKLIVNVACQRPVASSSAGGLVMNTPRPPKPRSTPRRLTAPPIDHALVYLMRANGAQNTRLLPTRLHPAMTGTSLREPWIEGSQV